MIQLDREQTATLKSWFLPERPGRLLGLHAIKTGHGSCQVDRWPDPRALIINIGFDYFLAGESRTFERANLQRIAGWVDVADETLARVLREARPLPTLDDRLVLELLDKPDYRTAPAVERCVIRPLLPDDTIHLERLTPQISWINNSWGGPAGLASSGDSWGAFVNGRLVSVACRAYVGKQYEDLGVVTSTGTPGSWIEHGMCGRGLRGDYPA